jgi:scyllo-inositol 2-dehydrogenase (NADP+)
MIRVGIVGMGRSGCELHAKPLLTQDGYQVVAAADPSPARRAEAERLFAVRTFGLPEELVASPDVDLVVVASPSSLHRATTVAALEAGKHVVVEKPMATSLADADAMLEAASRSRGVLTAFHNRRFDRDYQMVKRIVRDGHLGGLLNVASRVMTYGPEWANYGVPEFDPQWRTKAAHGGGFLADWGPHLVEQVLDLTGEWPVKVSAQLRGQLWATEVEDYFDVRLTFPSGLVATLEGSNNSRIPMPRWLVVGREGTLVAEGRWGEWTSMRVSTQVAGAAADILPQDVGPSSGSRNLDVGEELSAQFYTDLRQAIETGRPPAITAARARDVVALLEAARESHALQQTVEAPACRATRPEVAAESEALASRR